jgi:hypothetical protein
MPSQSVALSLILMASFVEGVATAQSSNGYVIGGVGSDNSKLTSQAAIGGEVVFGKGIGAGGELGFVAGHESFGFVSLNAYYHFVRHGAAQRADPFVTGGFTKGFDPFLGPFSSAASGNAANIGFGLQYWVVRHLGVRAEFRDIVLPGNSPGTNFWGLRGGFAFR